MMETVFKPQQNSASDAWLYAALAFTFSWTAWIVAIKLHAPEEFLNIGTAGPSLAAIFLTSRNCPERPRHPVIRTVAFLLLLAACWMVLAMQHRWTGGPHPHNLNPWLLIPAVFPAWIISAALSRNAGVRNLLQRLVHRPDRWSLLGFLLFPAILLPGTLLAWLLHLPLVKPAHHGSATIFAASAIELFLFNIIFVGVLEEPGWRGCLLDRLLQRQSPLIASLLVWLPWALWHAPLDYFRPGPFSLTLYLETRVIFLIPIALILTWLYRRSGHSIQSTALFHASMNTFPLVLPYFLPGFALLFIVAGYVVVSDRMWRRPAGSAVL